MNDEQLLRYSRQIMLPQIDVVGQEKLLQSTALIVGMGGLGSPVAMYLAASGVGHLLIVDHDRVDLTNLQRQIIHTTDDINEQKVISAKRNLLKLNPQIRVTAIAEKLDTNTLNQWLPEVDVVLDASDNFATRFAINKACVATRTPLVSGAAIQFEGQVIVFNNKPDSPCYQCLYQDIQEPDVTCSENGVLAPVTGIIGAVQATEAIKLLTGVGKTLQSRLMILDALNMEWRTITLNRDPHCKICSSK